MTGLKGEDARDKAKLEMEIFVNKVKVRDVCWGLMRLTFFFELTWRIAM